KLYERWAPRFLRRRAVDRAAKWMFERFQGSDGLGAIFPPIIYTIISLHCLGYAWDSDEMQYNLKQLDDLMIEENDTIRLQPCFPAVWDTAMAVNPMALVGKDSAQGALKRAADWLFDKEVRTRGDWSALCPHLEEGGWFFEYRNAFYPDVDDTAMVLMGLAR